MNTYPRPYLFEHGEMGASIQEYGFTPPLPWGRITDIVIGCDCEPFVTVSEDHDVILGFRIYGQEVFFRLNEDHARVYLRGLQEVVAPQRRTDDE